MKKLKKFTRQLLVHLMIFSLVQTTVLLNTAHAQTMDSNTTAVLGIAQSAVGIYGQYLQQKQQDTINRVTMLRNQQLMQQMSPSCRKPDGTSCYAVVGKLFPECALPASMSAMPQNICTSATPDVNQISTMITYENIANGWINYYEQMSNEASNMTAPIGLKCLQDKQKAVESQLTEMINNMTRLQDALNKDKETFRANTKKMLEELKTTNEELFGASGDKNLKIQTQDFSKYFSSSCLSVLGDAQVKEGAQIGFNGLLQTVIPKSKDASDYNQNRAKIEDDVRRDITKIQQNIKDTGLEDWSTSWNNNTALEGSKFGSVNTTIAKQNKEFLTAKARISKELSSIGYEIPAMDKNFAVDFDSFLAGSKDFFRKQYINNCVTGADNTGVAISTDQILSSLEQKSTNSAGTARDKYKAALANIIGSDAFIEDKLKQIKNLETVYKDITITYQSSGGQKVIDTPYQLYQKTISRCSSRFEQDDTFTSKGSNGVSYKKKVERGQQLLQELKGLHGTYTSRMGQLVLEKVLNCNGEAKKAGASCGDKGSFDPAGDNFCMAQANQCANEVQGCYAEANSHVETRKLKMQNLAMLYNANVQGMITRSNQLYDAQKIAVMNMVKVIQSRFPGSNFQIPEGMFVSMPEMKKDSFGVDLLNDGNPAFMDELPKKVELLKTVFKEQQQKANDTIQDYIQKQTAAMETNKAKWEKVASQCKSMADTSSKELAKMNAEGQKAQDELDRKVASFCSKFSGLSENPVAACEDAKDLAEDMDKIQARLTSGALQTTRQFKNACNSFNNESSEIPSVCEKENKTAKEKKYCDSQYDAASRSMANADASNTPGKSKKTISLSSLCGSSDEPKSDGEFIKSSVAKFPKEIQEELDGITNIKELAERIEDQGVDDGDFFNEMKALAGRYDSSSSLCKKLLAIDETEEVDEASLVKNDSQKLFDEAEKKSDEAEDLPATHPEKTARTRDAINLKKAAEKAKLAEKEAAGAGMKTNAADLKKKEKLKEVLSSLTPLEPSARDNQIKEVQKIGEQATQACDAQASNNNMPKIPGFDLQAYDKAALGTTK